MGLFLSASGVLSPDSKAVRKAIASFTATTGGTFELRAAKSENSNLGVMQSSASTTTVLYPDGFSDWDELSKFLSNELRVPVFSFHIHDGDFWMFVAFDRGQEVARFNPIPDYWEEVDDSERARWSGDARVVVVSCRGFRPIPSLATLCPGRKKTWRPNAKPTTMTNLRLAPIGN